MDNNASTNICTRCGKIRVFLKTWNEETDTFFGKSFTKHTIMVCPDSDCQIIVEKKFEDQKQKTLLIKAEREERIKKAGIQRGRKFMKS